MIFTSSDVARALAAAERVTGRRPFGAQILAHIERAGHLVTGELPRESIRERRAVHFTHAACDPHVVAGNRSGKLASDKIALMRSGELAALLLHVEGVIRARGCELDTDVPAAGEIARGRHERGRLPRRTLRR